jgi:TonB family protein
MFGVPANRIRSIVLRRGMALFPRLLLAVVIATICHAQEERKTVQSPAPAYPSFARRISLTGTVKVKAIVGPDGLVKQVEVVGGHPLFVDAAVDAVKKWKYAPGKTETSIELEFHFRP